MAVEYSVAEKLQLTVIRVRGVATAEEFAETNSAILGDPTWAPHFDTLTLVDPDTALHQLDPSSLRRLAESTRPYHRDLNLGRVRRAIVGGTVMGGVLAKYYVELQSDTSGCPVEYKVFSDVEAAVAWLGRSMGDVAGLLV